MINWTLGHGTSLCAVWHMGPPWIADGIIDYILQYNRWNMLRVLYIHTIICVYFCFNISHDISWQDDVNPDTIYWVTRRASDHAFNAKRCIEHQHFLWALWHSVEYIGTMKRGLYIARSISFFRLLSLFKPDVLSTYHWEIFKYAKMLHIESSGKENTGTLVNWM